MLHLIAKLCTSLIVAAFCIDVWRAPAPERAWTDKGCWLFARLTCAVVAVGLAIVALWA